MKSKKRKTQKLFDYTRFDSTTNESLIRTMMLKRQSSDPRSTTLRQQVEQLFQQRIAIEREHKLIVRQQAFIDSYCKNPTQSPTELANRYDEAAEEMWGDVLHDDQVYFNERNQPLADPEQHLKKLKDEYSQYAQCPITAGTSIETAQQKKTELQTRFEILLDARSQLQEKIQPLAEEYANRDEAFVKQRNQALQDASDSHQQRYPELATACQQGELENVKTLLASCPKKSLRRKMLSALDGDGESPLHLACLAGHTGIVTELLKAGANSNQKNRQGYSAMHSAVACKDFEKSVSLLKQLAAAGAKIKRRELGGRTVLHSAAYYGNLLAAAHLLEQGVDINAQETDASLDKLTALHKAVATHNFPMVQYLLQRGADATLASRQGETPLVMTLLLYHSQSIHGDINLHGDEIITAFFDAGYPLQEPDIEYINKYAQSLPTTQRRQLLALLKTTRERQSEENSYSPH